MKRHTIIKLTALLAALLLSLGLCACAKDEPKDTGDAYYISYEGTKICPGKDADGLLERLGEPRSEKNNGNCGGQGVQMKYSYSSFDLYLLESTDGTVTVDQISVKDDLIETPEGICIGEDADAVKKTYGDPSKETAKTLVYRKGAQELIFKVEGGKVVAIDLIHVTQ